MISSAIAACGGAQRGPPPEALEAATTTIVPDGEKCPDVVGELRAVAILARAGSARPVGRVSATRLHRDTESACTWAEDGAASAARRLGADAVVIGSRRADEDGDLARCVVEARAYLRGDGEFLRACERETVRGVEREPE